MFDITNYQKGFSLISVTLAAGKDLNSCFYMLTAIMKWVQGVKKILSKCVPANDLDQLVML